MNKYLHALTQLLGATLKMDSKDSPFLLEELTQIEAEIYKVEYPDLMARQVVPFKSTGLNPGAASFVYRVYDWFGVARFVTGRSDDLDLVSVAGERFSQKVEMIGDAYDYDVDELAAAQMSGFPLDREKALAAAEAIERKIDHTVAKGDPETDFEGFLNHSAVTIETTAANGVASATTWASKLALTDGTGPTKILADLHAFLQSIATDSKGKIRPDRLVMPQSLYSLIATTPMSSTGYSSETILSTFLKTSTFIKSDAQITVWYEADNAAANGKGRMVAYKADRRYMEVYEPVTVRSLPAQPRNFKFIVPLYSKFGGLVLRQPLAVRYLDGAES